MVSCMVKKEMKIKRADHVTTSQRRPKEPRTLESLSSNPHFLLLTFTLVLFSITVEAGESKLIIVGKQ